MKIAILSSLALAARATLGVDYADNFSLNDMHCLRGHGIEFASPRAWHSYGAMDTNAVPAIATARKAGIPNVDVYLFPCRGKNAAS